MHNNDHTATNSPTSVPRDTAIIEHVARFRLSTNAVVARLFFVEQGPAAVRKVTARLCASKHLSRFPFRHPRTYFTLGKNAVAERGLPPHRAWPLGPQSLAIEYAVLAYATLGSRYHHRLTQPELHSELSWPVREQGEATYCVDQTPRGRLLELLRVDLGGKSDHVARKCQRVLAERLRAAQFEHAVRSGGVRLVVITGSLSKAEAIRSSLGQHVWPAGLDLHLAIVQDLLLFSSTES